MILWLHRLRHEEDGQTLVLGAVFGIILALCVMGTVNMGRAVYQKIQVQTACDNGAYSQAAVEARVLNLTAYTNRAMVVHYSSMMAMSAYLTWIHFTFAWVDGLLKLGELIPGLGEILAVIEEVLQVLVHILDVAVAVLTPIVSAANVVLYGLQEGAWASLYGGRLLSLPPEAHSGDPSGHPYQALAGLATGPINATVFAQTRGTNALPTSIAQSLAIFLNSSSAPVQEARLHMLEIANSSREPWVAYGDHYNVGTSLLPLARHWAIDIPFPFCNIKIGVNARTELGSYAPAPGSGIAGLFNTTGQIYSGSRADTKLKCLGVSMTVRIFDLTTVDEFLGFAGIPSQHTYQGLDDISVSGPWLIKDIVKGTINGLLSPLSAAAVAAANSGSSFIADYRAMWISPYVFFSPSTRSSPAGGLSSLGGQLGNFGQPDVIYGLNSPDTSFNAAPSSGPSTFLNQQPVKSIIPGQNGKVSFAYTSADTPSIPGLPAQLQVLSPGFNALCAAQAYYHRPGDWKEMPNFFNPLWAARLMPVTESNAGASLGMNLVSPVLNQLLLH